MFACEKFAKVDIHTDINDIKPEDRGVLSLLIQAGKFLNAVYLRQVSSYNPQFKQEIEDTRSERLIESFEIMAGPWDRFNDDKPFYGNIEKPLGAGFYPADMTRETFELWCKRHPEASASMTSFTTIIKRVKDGLVAVPYSQAYQLELEKASSLLEQASEIAVEPTLKRYLHSRAQSLLTNEYAQSEADWIHLDSDVECVFGPYETYEDRLFGYKATFEAFIGYRIEEETRKLAHLSGLMEEMQASLPITEAMKATQGEVHASPFTVIDLLSTAGEAKYGVQTLAFVLPNDPEVIRTYGTKKVMLRNIQKAKFEAILRPIAARFLGKETLSKLSFEAFFRHTLLHETGHSLGVKAVRDSGQSIIHALADAYAPIEECKADTISTFLTYWLWERGELTRADVDETCATLLAGFFRSLRFGVSQAHARANAIQLNYYMEQGAVTVDESGIFACDAEKIGQASRGLISKICALQYEGDRASASAFLDRYAILSDSLTHRLGQLDDIAVDIVCRYEAENGGFFE